MKKKVVLWLLALCVLLTACGKPPQFKMGGKALQKQEVQFLDDENGDSAQLPVDQETKDEDKKDEETKDEETKESKPEPKYEPLVTVSSSEERIVGAADWGLSAGMEQVMLDMQDRYYQSVGSLEVKECSDLFATSAEANYHKAVWRSLIAIRKASLIDLHLVDYDFTFYCADVTWYGEEYVDITLTEDAVMYFAATSYVPSEQYETLHTFSLVRVGQDSWEIDEHYADDNPYYNFSYDKNAGCDSRLNTFLANVAARQATRGGASTSSLTWDHDYDRSAAYSYMQTYIEWRNDDWYVYDYVGGNCQNFGSQVLLAGGIPMDTEGNAQWYWYDHYDQDYSWINVGRFMDYARANTGYGLVCDAYANYYTGQTGDILIMGSDGLNHTTVIADTITSGGSTVDYLICSNTSNYRNFPASAYYYTQQWVAHILGWNDAEQVPPAGGDGNEGGEPVDPPGGGDGGEPTDPPASGDGEGGEPTDPPAGGDGEEGGELTDPPAGEEGEEET